MNLKEIMAKGENAIEQRESINALLARFTADNPCWTRDLLLMAGENSNKLDSSLAALINEGCLHKQEDIYWLTDAGKNFFKALAMEWYLADKPGDKPDNPQERLFITKLWLNLERCNRQVGGEKDYLFDISIPVRPAVNPIFMLKEDKLRWLWPDHPSVQAMEREFPLVDIASRAIDTVSPQRWQMWQENSFLDQIPLKIDLMFLCRYDMVHYLNFSGHPNDRHKLINTDRFCFVKANDIGMCLETLGKYHLWLHELRHVAIPGYVDVDTEQQSSANWLIFMTEIERHATELAAQLAAFGEELTRPAMPMELWTLSMENLESTATQKDVIWELLPFISHAVWPPR